jgi:hypothetical protein
LFFFLLDLSLANTTIYQIYSTNLSTEEKKKKIGDKKRGKADSQIVALNGKNIFFLFWNDRGWSLTSNLILFLSALMNFLIFFLVLGLFSFCAVLNMPLSL